MQRAIDIAIKTAKRRGHTPVEIRLGEPLLDALRREAPDTETGLFRSLPLVQVAAPEHASLKVTGGSHIEIKTT